ncbi:coumaroyl-CoA:anthocyanidin 3-O-glucoside-6''-O-coumaroyltransferase 1-like [Senna tora]|uniref:Coumaroyl-CoA:anthocyanidin 3-O-glucoside-6''-O-coumaroyltransferase 1-like n=1 Tax=Senna tora TaxID=362788 RepID=A0A834W1K1_9FABA|nr:coumaroyl-CoA:anthocyanidin 3-O-glucoside-6''-O-coumaroyltransferase 1-like [Senna tora]
MNAMAVPTDVKILNHFEVAPPPASVSSTTLPLSFLDIPWLNCLPMERLFFYQHPHPTHHFIQTILPTLTHSLSLALRHFFPFASLFISTPCPHKPHILYVDAQSSVPLTLAESSADFNYLIADYPRHVTDLHPLIPTLPPARVLDDGSQAYPLMAIQFTVFPGSGFSIGVIFRHVAADGKSFHHFMKSWASICRNRGTEEMQEIDAEPIHDRVSVQDPDELEEFFLNWWWNVGKNRMMEVKSDIFINKVRATIVLRRAQIEKLKNWVSELANTTKVSSFVATCSLIWVCLLKSEEKEGDGEEDDDKPCCFVFSADCRNRYGLSIPETYFGNCLAFCYVGVKRKVVVGEFGLGEAAKAIGNKVKEMEREGLGGAKKWVEYWKEMGSGLHKVIVGASPRFKVYETDFGWGKVKKSEVVHTDKLGIISLAESRDEEGGIEIGLSLPKDQMERFNVILNKCLGSM